MNFASELKLLDYRIQWLTRNAAQEEVQRLARIASVKRQDLGCNSILTGGALRALELDVVYALMRHRRWLNCDLFLQTLSHHLAQDHGLIHANCLAWLRACGIEAAGNEPAKVFFRPSDDRNFLLYIFVEMLNATDQQRLIVDLGIGVALLQAIRSLADTLGSTQPTDAVHFLPAIDADLLTIIEEFSIKLGKAPWVVDQYKLELALNQLSTFWAHQIAEKTPSWILDQLCVLGRDHSRTRAEMGHLFACEGSNLDEWLDILGRLGLTEHHQERKRLVWNLSSEGYDLTARYFAAKYGHEWTVQTFNSYNPAWQTALIRALTPEQIELAVDLLSKPQSLHSESLLAVVAFLRPLLEPEHLEAVLAPLARNGITHNIRSAAAEAMSRTSNVRGSF